MANKIFWFRNDLRLGDNPALAAAMSGASRIALLYVLDEAATGDWAMGGASRWWLHHTLHSLSQDIAARGGRLLLRRGKAVECIPQLATELQATEIHAGRDITAWGERRDKAIEAKLKSAGVEFHRHLSSQLFAPEDVKTKAKGVYGRYTPFSQACFQLAAGMIPAKAVAAPARFSGFADAVSGRLEDWKLLPERPDWAGGLRQAWMPGEKGAAKRLQQFLTQALAGYKTGRNLPAESGTSGLSPHLHFGEISPATLWRAVQAKKSDAGRDVFLKELLWREFSAYLLWHHPSMPDQPLRPQFAKFPWSSETKLLTAWQRGQTGIPIVDAGMRQLWQTGWMHNRIRMVCASFLTKHLLIPWQRGEAWFWDTLVDADLANNSANWQWVAGCGADAAPYFRIFNPVLQGRKFDPAGAYVRRFVPELAGLPDNAIHAPWEADHAVLAAAKITLGKTYPHPIIDLAIGRERALTAYRKTTGTK